MAVEQPDDLQAESQGCADVRTVIAAALFTVAIQFSTAGWNSGKKTAGTVAHKRLFPRFFLRFILPLLPLFALSHCE